MKQNVWIQIAVAESDAISDELLKWSGLSDVWEAHELSDSFDFKEDVADLCSRIHISREEVDGGVPTHSWILYSVETDDEELLRREMQEKLQQLIS